MSNLGQILFFVFISVINDASTRKLLFQLLEKIYYDDSKWFFFNIQADKDDKGNDLGVLFQQIFKSIVTYTTDLILVYRTGNVIQTRSTF